MKARTHQRAGFTLVEIVVASSLLVIALSMAFGGFIYVLRAARESNEQDVLDVQVQKAMERLKYDLRLSSLTEMVYYPAGAGPYTAISLPLARDDDGDGLVETNNLGRIDWDLTRVYHVHIGSPDQLRMTTFDPRDNSLTDTERQAQINAVVSTGGGGGTYNGTNATTTTIFENLVDWDITPDSAIYDGYNSTPARDDNVRLGSAIISNGTHTVTFTLVDKNTNSTGYKVGVDRLVMSPSQMPREAEDQLPVQSESGASATKDYMASGSWSANYHLSFPASATGHSFTLVMDSDRWEDRNFRGTGYQSEDTTVVFDSSVAPSDYLVKLEGFKTNWYASEQSWNSTGTGVGGNALTGAVVRVLVKGKDMPTGGFLDEDGNRASLYFKPSDLGNFGIDAMYIAECASSVTASPNALVGSQIQLVFADGSWSKTLLAGTDDWSYWTRVTDPVLFNIDREKSYLVTYKVSATDGNPWAWQDTSTNLPHSYAIPNGTLADVADADWSAKPYFSTNIVIGLQYLWVSYPTNGTYISEIFDTKVDAPEYSAITWSEYIPAAGGDIKIKVRSGANSDLSDAADWSVIGAISSPGAINPGDNRYVQYMAILEPPADRLDTPKLQDVTITWDSEALVSDIGGAFTKGPDYGVFEISIDGATLKKGLLVDLEIYKDVIGAGGTHRITSTLVTEIRPRNTGK